MYRYSYFTDQYTGVPLVQYFLKFAHYNLLQCEGMTNLHRHGVELLEDVAEVGLVDLVAPHGEVVEVEDGGPVLQ